MIRNEFNGIGRLGKDPIIRHTEGGNKVASFSIAISEKYKKDGQDVEKTEWVNIVCWNKIAVIVEQWLKKGYLIAV